MPTRVFGRPVPAALAGAVAIAFFAILYRFADVSPDRRILPLRRRRSLRVTLVDAFPRRVGGFSAL